MVERKERMQLEHKRSIRSGSWLFAGSLRAEKRAAAIMSLLQSAKLNGHEPLAYLKDVLAGVPTQPARRVGELLPHRCTEFIADDEVHALAEHLKQYGAPDYVDAMLGSTADSDAEAGGSSNLEENAPLYDQAVAVVIDSRRASISLVQRRLRIGYNRAARLVEQMEIAGLVSPMESNGSRIVLVPNQ